LVQSKKVVGYVYSLSLRERVGVRGQSKRIPLIPTFSPKGEKEYNSEGPGIPGTPRDCLWFTPQINPTDGSVS